MLIRFYQLFISPFLGANCRFQPSCSQYAYNVLTQYGFLRGVWMTFRRLLRCHPFYD